MSAYNSRVLGARTREVLVGLIVLTVVLIPLIWLILLSFKPVGETYALPIRWLPQEPTLEPYRQVWLSEGIATDWLRFLVNTSVVAVAVSLAASYLGMYLGYVLSRSRGKWIGAVLVVIVVAQLLNGPALVVPLYVLVNVVGLYDTLLGYGLVLLVFMLPFAALISFNYAGDVPNDLDEAGFVDGASRWQVFRRIFLPLARPGLITTGLMVFLLTWGEYPFAIVLLESRANMTIAPGMFELISGLNIHWNQMASAAVIVSLPVLVVLVTAQRYLVRGLLSGANKG